MKAQPGRPDSAMIARRPTLLFAFAVVFALSLVGANLAGRGAAQADIERLEEVWPFLDRLPESDRAFLAGLAMTCKLHRRSSERGEVVDCLRTAATDPDAILPSSVSQADAASKLEQMLSYSPAIVSTGS